MARNNLTEAETERLAWLLEELGEAQQAIGKILRHGYESYDPTDTDHPGNRADLAKEIADVEQAVSLMIDAKDLKRADIALHRSVKPRGRYLWHQPRELIDYDRNVTQS